MAFKFFSEILRSQPNKLFFYRRFMVTRQSGAYLDEPKRQTRFGLLKVFLTVITGLSIGAWVSQKMAAFLEENELFVPEDDDDDDDDDD